VTWTPRRTGKIYRTPSRAWAEVPEHNEEHYLRFAEISDRMARAEEEVDGVDWSESPFSWIVTKLPKAKGVVFENLVRRNLEACGVPVGNRTGSKHDLIVCGHKIEIKVAFVAMMASGRVHFVWNSVKTNGYDFVMLFVVFPHAMKLVFMSRVNFLAINRFRNQQYADAIGTMVDVCEGSEMWDEWMARAGDFEERFEQVVSFFRREYHADGYLCDEDGRTIMEEKALDIAI